MLGTVVPVYAFLDGRVPLPMRPKHALRMAVENHK